MRRVGRDPAPSGTGSRLVDTDGGSIVATASHFLVFALDGLFLGSTVAAGCAIGGPTGRLIRRGANALQDGGQGFCPRSDGAQVTALERLSQGLGLLLHVGLVGGRDLVAQVAQRAL